MPTQVLHLNYLTVQPKMYTRRAKITSLGMPIAKEHVSASVRFRIMVEFSGISNIILILAT